MMIPATSVRKCSIQTHTHVAVHFSSAWYIGLRALKAHMRSTIYFSSVQHGIQAYVLAKPICALSFSSVQFSSTWYIGLHAREAHMRSTSSLTSFPSTAFKTVSMFVLFKMTLFHPFKEDRRALILSTPLSSRRPIIECPWLCARRQCLKLLNTSDLPRSKQRKICHRAIPKQYSLPQTCLYEKFLLIGSLFLQSAPANLHANRLHIKQQ